jgi:LuxR family maltose regulon positive regulatory protein
MSCRTPLVEPTGLYEPGITQPIALGTPAWFAWLSDDRHCSFHFRHPLGDFTARKERKQRGQWYWVAYRQIHGKLYKTYLGKSEALTETHLCAAAQDLARAADTRSPVGAGDAASY